MEFDFDEVKSESNKVKHGIDFYEAQNLWTDINGLIIPARTIDEPRYLLIAKYKNKYWTSIITIRNEKIRIISVRRARENEKKLYKSEGI